MTDTSNTSSTQKAGNTAEKELRSTETSASREESATESKIGREASATADKARSEASRTYSTAADEAERLRDKAYGLGEQARNAASTAADEARSYARSFADEQKATAADSVRDVSKALGDAADRLDEHYGFVAGYVRDAAGEVDRVASSIKDRSVDDIFYSVESFARRQPTAFLGATVLAGFALARFVKSSAPAVDYETAGYRGSAHYGVPADRPGQTGTGAGAGAYDDPYRDAGIPQRAVNPPNRTSPGSRPGDLASGTSGTSGTSGSAAATSATSGGSTYTSGTSASSPVSGSGATKSA